MSANGISIAELEVFFSRDTEEIRRNKRIRAYCASLLSALEEGMVRAAQLESDGSWSVNAWVKAGILAAFRASELVAYPDWPGGAVDKDLFPPRTLGLGDGIRAVPGGSVARRGARLCPGAVLMPPCYINAGAWVGEGSMVDSNVLVGSCAQVGAAVHLSAGVQLGGVLEPPGALPVIIGDGCFLGALSAVLEGVRLGERAVLAPGVILSASSILYDLVQETELRGFVPAGAVVVPGSRPAGGGWAAARGLSLYAPCIVKYRDGKTDAATALEGALR